MLNGKSLCSPEKTKKPRGADGASSVFLPGAPKGSLPHKAMQRVNTWSHQSQFGILGTGQTARPLDTNLIYATEVKSTTPALSKKAVAQKTQIMLMPAGLDAWTIQRARSRGEHSSDVPESTSMATSLQHTSTLASAPSSDRSLAKGVKFGVDSHEVRIAPARSTPPKCEPQSTSPDTSDKEEDQEEELTVVRRPKKASTGKTWKLLCNKRLNRLRRFRARPKAPALEVEQASSETAAHHEGPNESSEPARTAVKPELSPRDMSKCTVDLRDSPDGVLHNSWFPSTTTDTEEESLEIDDGQFGMSLSEYFAKADAKRNGNGRRLSSSFSAGNRSPLGDSSPSVKDSQETLLLFDAADSAAVLTEQKKEAVRHALVKAAGGAMHAFRILDMSGNLLVSPSEFNDGMQRLGVNWQEITGFTRCQEVYNMFDLQKSLTLTLDELFPDARLHLGYDRQRMSTPEFWSHWCKRTGNAENGERLHSPKWVPSGRDEELKAMCRSAEQRHEIERDRRHMVKTIAGLKKEGMSDARCREFVATHLPRGTGPKDRDDISSFSEAEVRSCRRAYNDPILTQARNIQKSIFDMKEQRQVLKGSRHKLWASIMDPHAVNSRVKDDKAEQKRLFESARDTHVQEVSELQATGHSAALSSYVENLRSLGTAVSRDMHIQSGPD